MPTTFAASAAMRFDEKANESKGEYRDCTYSRAWRRVPLDSRKGKKTRHIEKRKKVN